jgi:hypothetical protein
MSRGATLPARITARMILHPHTTARMMRLATRHVNMESQHNESPVIKAHVS